MVPATEEPLATSLVLMADAALHMAIAVVPMAIAWSQTAARTVVQEPALLHPAPSHRQLQHPCRLPVASQFLVHPPEDHPPAVLRLPTARAARILEESFAVLSQLERAAACTATVAVTLLTAVLDARAGHVSVPLSSLLPVRLQLLPIPILAASRSSASPEFPPCMPV